MKKLLISMMLLLCASGMYAQFEKNTWFFNPSVTGMDLSYNKHDSHFGLELNTGAFLVDNFALLLSAKGDYRKNSVDETGLGVGCRYYFDNVGVYLGLGMNYKHWSFEGKKSDDFGANIEAGYAFFLSRTVTLEPALYYDLSFDHPKDLSRFGLKVGFGIYF